MATTYIEGLTIDCVDVTITANFLHEQPRLRRCVGIFNSAESLTCGQRGQAQIVLTSCRHRVASNLIVKSRCTGGGFIIVGEEVAQLWLSVSRDCANRCHNDNLQLRHHPRSSWSTEKAQLARPGPLPRIALHPSGAD